MWYCGAIILPNILSERVEVLISGPSVIHLRPMALFASLILPWGSLTGRIYWGVLVLRINTLRQELMGMPQDERDRLVKEIGPQEDFPSVW